MEHWITRCAALVFGTILCASCADRPFELELSMVADSLETYGSGVDDGWFCHYTLEVRANGGEEGDWAEYLRGTLSRDDFAWEFGADGVGFGDRRQARYIVGWQPNWSEGPARSPTEPEVVSFEFRMPDGSLESLTASEPCADEWVSGGGP
jgi:hypothetical protein